MNIVWTSCNEIRKTLGQVEGGVQSGSTLGQIGVGLRGPIELADNEIRNALPLGQVQGGIQADRQRGSPLSKNYNWTTAHAQSSICKSCKSSINNRLPLPLSAAPRPSLRILHHEIALPYVGRV